ncbi:endocuticle structural glycoprotein SgAbd-3 [Glossina fuscipes]|uniref:Endocuticle structural glycoprotein SgAbd-3 n=1 Tax=Glossina fuscipes TaxID=7396 RepID=A0A8U0W7M5_9MUSC|nr:endocuticle structural glycoprotein SgAbd-3 [Glossina fuscipes]KAI9587674.1 hypothetical protein GQX74_003520 [Glossina fuscipes]
MIITMRRVQFLIIAVAVVLTHHVVRFTVGATSPSVISLQFGFETENGQQRNEHIRYDRNSVLGDSNEEMKRKPLEYRGDYSFTSDDGYQYVVKYKANENGFQPYVTAHKVVKN